MSKEETRKVLIRRAVPAFVFAKVCRCFSNVFDLDLSECEPLADFSFSIDFNDMVYAGTSNVNIDEGSAVFAGNGW